MYFIIFVFYLIDYNCIKKKLVCIRFLNDGFRKWRRIKSNRENCINLLIINLKIKVVLSLDDVGDWECYI